MNDADRIYQLFAEANPAPVSVVATFERPEAPSLILEPRRPIMHQQPTIPKTRPVKSPTRRWSGGAVALTWFVVVVAVIGLPVWLGLSGNDRPVATETTLPLVTNTVPTTSASTTSVPPVIAVPNLRGMTLADARVLAETVGLQLIEPEGSIDSAIIVTQNPAPGIEVSEGAAITVAASVSDTCTPTAPDAPGIGQINITVLFECGGDGLYPTPGIALPRLVPEQGGEPIDRIEWTMRTLLAGPTDDERAAGFTSFFNDATTNALDRVALTDGHVVVEFNNDIYVNNANTSTGSLFFNAELRANIFQHPEVDSVEFHVNGDCEAWSTYFQSDGCWIITRTDWEQQLAEWAALRR